MARARLTVDLDAIAANWRALDALSAPSVETAAVVKADAYGLGTAAVAPALARAGARSFFVALAEEGAALRAGARPRPGDPRLRRPDARRRRARPRATTSSPASTAPRRWRAFAEALPGRPCALQLDSGMNRLGLEPAELAAAAHLLPRLAPVLAISHLACADEPEHPMNAAQPRAFAAAAAVAPRRPPQPRRRPAAPCSAPTTTSASSAPASASTAACPSPTPAPSSPSPCRSSRSATSPPARRSATAPPGSPPARRASPPSPPATPTACRAPSAAAASRSTPATPPARSSAGSRWT